MTDLVARNDQVALFDTPRFEQMQRVATAMAQAELVPKHLQGKPADCLMVCQQSERWQMDPFAVAQSTFTVSGKLGYEGKLVAAVINSRAHLKGRLRYDIEGEADAMKVVVSGCFQDEDTPRTIEATVAEAKKFSKGNNQWQIQPDQMLCYYGARKWGRRHAPELMLGVLSDDEVAGARPMHDITPEDHPPAQQLDSLDDLVEYHEAAPGAEFIRPEAASDDPSQCDSKTGEITDEVEIIYDDHDDKDREWAATAQEGAEMLANRMRAAGHFQATRMLSLNSSWIMKLPKSWGDRLEAILTEIQENAASEAQGRLIGEGAA